MSIQLLLATADLEQQINGFGIKTVLVSTAIIAVCTVLAVTLSKKKFFGKLKLPLFILMAGSLVGSTLILMGGTVYLNTKSESKGPVHWHTGIEFWACGTELDLRNPKGALSNKIGTSTYHEHDDKFIHLEGVVVRKSEDASLEKFMAVTGGYIQDGAIAIPVNDNSDEWFASETNDKLDGDKQGNTDPDLFKEFIKKKDAGSTAEFADGQKCGNKDGKVQAFLYTFNEDDDTYSQRKLEKPGEYTMRDVPILGPPGDCLIVEFDEEKDRTDKLCQQYGVKDEKRCTEFGVTNFNTELCHIKEVTTGGNL